jgi:hypothetical protein
MYISMYIHIQGVSSRSSEVNKRTHSSDRTHSIHIQGVSSRSSRSALYRRSLPPMSNSTVSGTLREHILVREHILRIVSQILAAHVQLNGLRHIL